MKRRLLALALGFALAFAALIVKLADLQLAHGQELARRAAEGRRRVELTPAPRGRILDRAGRELAFDVPRRRLVAVLADLDPGLVLPGRVAQVLHRPRAELEARWSALEAECAGERLGPPLLLAVAPSPRSVRAFKGIAAGFEGLVVEGKRLLVTRDLVRRREITLERVIALGRFDEASVSGKIAAARSHALAARDDIERRARLQRRVPLGETVPFEVAAEVEEEARIYPGIEVEEAPERSYPFGTYASHILGFIRPETRTVTAFDVPVELRERTGAGGIEAARDLALSGSPGARLIEKNGRTGQVTVLDEELPRAGSTVRLTIDMAVQRAAVDAIDEGVAANAGPGGGGSALLLSMSGEVLALATAPRPEGGQGLSEERVRSAAPFLNRPIGAELAPGSIVKTLVAAAALESSLITPETTVHCEGRLAPNLRHFKCDGVHGDIAACDALARSCNVFFFRTGEKLGEEPLATWLSAFGFGVRTGIELPGERPGLVPSGAWKRERHRSQLERVRRGEGALFEALGGLGASALLALPPGLPVEAGALSEVVDRSARLAVARETLGTYSRDRAWTLDDSRNTAIGQGNVLCTPLQAARLAAAIASGGTLFRPRIVKDPGATAESGIGDDGEPRARDLVAGGDETSPPEGGEGSSSSARGDERAGSVEVPERSRIDVAPATWELIRRGMVLCVEKGTAAKSELARFHAAAKTGTAELPPHGSHAWVIGFAPADRPEVVFAVEIERVPDHIYGGDVAAPVAAKMLRAYFESRVEAERP